MNIDRVMTDLLVLLHAGFIAFVVLGLVAILVGAVLRWRWVRNIWFRAAHLGAILFVVVQAWLGQICPLTLLEAAFRRRAGQAAYSDRLEEVGFIAYWLHQLIFPDLEPWVFTVIYTVFGTLVVVAFIVVPPRWGRRVGERS